MTHKEIDKFLANTKVYVNGRSNEIQEKLFSLGYKWPTGNTKVGYLDYPFLYIHKKKSFSRGSDMENFSNHENREITAEEILSLEPAEPSYRPFKDMEECWQEMLKHKPFGWLKHKENQYYNNCCLVYNGIDEDSFNDVYEDFTFADGTPFGIKEE